MFTWYYPLTADDTKAERTKLLSATREDWEAVVRADLNPAHVGLDEAAQRLDVMRWGHAMVRPYPGFVWGGARQAAGESVAGSLHFAHTDLGGLALFEEANPLRRARRRSARSRGSDRRTDTWLARSP